jgi:hypothetical protein
VSHSTGKKLNVFVMPEDNKKNCVKQVWRKSTIKETESPTLKKLTYKTWPMYSNPLPLPVEKIRNFMDLLQRISPVFRCFYRGLKHKMSFQVTLTLMAAKVIHKTHNVQWSFKHTGTSSWCRQTSSTYCLIPQFTPIATHSGLLQQHFLTLSRKFLRF